MAQRRDAVRRAWDAVAETYARSRSVDGEDAALLDELLDALPSAPHVLDLGCGDGRRTAANLLPGATVTGLDFSRRQLELAAEAVPAMAGVQADMTAIPFDAGTFDAAVAYHAIFHVPRTQHPVVYEELARVLRPGGLLLTTVGGSRHEGTRRNWLDSGVEMYWSTPGERVTREQLRDAGFEIRWARTVDDPLGSTTRFVLAERDSN